MGNLVDIGSGNGLLPDGTKPLPEPVLNNHLWLQVLWHSIECKINSLRPRQNGRPFADDTFKRIFLNENIRISTKNSLKFVPKGLINNIPAFGSDNGLAPTRRQAIIWTNAG